MTTTEADGASEGQVPRNEWKWFGHPGHLCVAHYCRFHLCTQVGDYLVSTVGEYWPPRSVREVHARVHDPAWLVENEHLKGDNFDAAYMKRFGYEEVGWSRLYETMVFRAGEPCQARTCGCGPPDTDGHELDAEGYMTAPAATKGHHAMCERWAARAALHEREPQEE